MFIVYHSNYSELFIHLMVSVMSHKVSSNPMQSEIILVENKIVEQWIEVELANYFDIAANIMFMNIRSFIQKVFSEIFENTVKINNLSYDVYYWKFLDMLPSLCLDKDCSIIKQFLNVDVNQKKCGQLSEQLSNLFLEYSLYRSDWLKCWKSNKVVENVDITHQVWQSKMWRMFLCSTKNNFHVVDILSCATIFVQNKVQENNYNLPNRIFIYGMISMPPMYWKILDLLSYHIDIYLWMIGPVINFDKIVPNDIIGHKINKYYNSNLRSTTLSSTFDVIKKNRDDQVNVNCQHYSNCLLNLYGNIGKDTLLQLSKLKNSFQIKAFIDPQSNSMLHVLQKDILTFQNLTLDKNKQFCPMCTTQNQKYILSPEDDSISIHVCYNVQREIEVLHDNLLSMLSNDSSLSPNDIVVAVFNIDDYVSAIETVFDNMFGRKLPFFIYNTASKIHEHPIISSILKVLNISHSRFTCEEVLSFLSIPAIASKFNISLEESKLLSQWITESGIRWGLDEDTMNNFNIPMFTQNTWDCGLKRMLLSYSIKNKDSIWNDIIPYDCVNENYIDIVSRLGRLLEILRKWRDRLRYSYTLKEWIPYVQEIINDFFNYSELNAEENNILFFLKKCWTRVLESGIRLGYSRPISIDILQDQLIRRLNQKKTNCQFLPYAIRFCDITSICFIPYKVLCCIGLSNLFPRNKLHYDFNLISKGLRHGDYNIREQDCYSFLLAILLTQKRIYISFISTEAYYFDVVSSQSVIINELVEFIAQNFCFYGEQHLNHSENLKRIRKHLYKWYANMPFDYKNFLPYSKQQSFATEWLNAAMALVDFDCSKKLNFVTALPICNFDTILFRDLYDFYQHPIRAWYQKRLGVCFYPKTLKLLNDEPFFEDCLSYFELNTRLLNCLVNNKNADQLYYENYIFGKLPYGSFGKLYWIKQYDRMYALSKQIKSYFCEKEAAYSFDVSIEFNAIKVVGQLHSVHKNGLIRWKACALSMKDCFLLWLEHLVYCASGGSGESRLFGIGNKWHFPNFSQSYAKTLLFPLILGFSTGMNTPLILLYKSGGAWINQTFDWINKIISSSQLCQNKALQKLIQTWEGNKKCSFSVGECHDPYLQKIIPIHLNNENIQKIIETAKEYFFNVMKHRILD